MQNTLRLPVLLLLPFLVAATACNNSPAAAGTPGATAAAAAASSDDDAVPGPVTFSLTINGTTVTGTSAAHFQYNQATTAIDPNDKPEFRFVLADIKTPDGKPTRTVMFQSPIAVGSHQVNCSGDDHFYGLEITFEENSYQYCGDNVVLNVTEVTDTRVKGNFSGKFTLLSRPQQDTIKADCTFDIPRVKQ